MYRWQKKSWCTLLTVPYQDLRHHYECFGGLCHTQCFLVNITNFHLNYFRDPTFLRWEMHFHYQNGWDIDKGGSVLCTWTLCCLWAVKQLEWPWRARWYDISRLVWVVLVQALFGHRMVVCYYCIPLVCFDLCCQQIIMRTHQERVMQATRERFIFWQIIFLRKSWIKISLNTMFGLSQPHSVFFLTSQMVCTFLSRRPWSWTFSGTWSKI